MTDHKSVYMQFLVPQSVSNKSLLFVCLNYQELKNSLLKLYNLTEEGFHEKFRKCRPEPAELVSQFIFELKLTESCGFS